jgi:hypothetical protein
MGKNMFKMGWHLSNIISHVTFWSHGHTQWYYNTFSYLLLQSNFPTQCTSQCTCPPVWQTCCTFNHSLFFYIYNFISCYETCYLQFLLDHAVCRSQKVDFSPSWLFIMLEQTSWMVIHWGTWMYFSNRLYFIHKD